MSINKGPVRDALEIVRKARATATMERAGFHSPTGTPNDSQTYTAEVRESTRLWRESWLLAPLDEAIKLLEKELAK